MDPHHINGMVLAIEKAGDARAGIESYWEDKIAIVWDVDDVLGAADDRNIILDEEDAIDILNAILNGHDSDRGVTWNTIDEHLNDYD